MNIESVIDHCLLDPCATITEIDKLCIEAKEHHFRAVCVLPMFVKRAKEMLKGTPVKTATIAGFPFGHTAIEAKLAETVLAIVDGADEIELVINRSALKNADWQYLAREINSIMPVIRGKGRGVKMILETEIMDEKEIITCCDIYGAAGVDGIITSSGYPKGVTSIEKIKLLRKHLADAVKLIAGGVPGDYAMAKQCIEAGADGIGSENSLEIVKSALV